jgi:large subunit ribosomal protein L2
MGKRIIQQRRGRGSHTYRVPQHALKPEIKYESKKGRVKDIIHYPLINAPLAVIQYDDKSSGYLIAPEGVRVGDSTDSFVSTLSNIKEGSQIFCLETMPNSGPKLCRTPGSAATLVSKGSKHSVVQLPSKKKKKLNNDCRAIIGIPAGDGRKEKPFVKAGVKWITKHKRGKLYPITSAKGMNAVDHPFGGSGHGTPRPPASRHAPPGRKVGTLAPRRTGKKR